MSTPKLQISRRKLSLLGKILTCGGALSGASLAAYQRLSDVTPPVIFWVGAVLLPVLITANRHMDRLVGLREGPLFPGMLAAVNFTIKYFEGGPERTGLLLSFLIPRKIRQNAFEPYFEELKEDRLFAKGKVHSKAGKCWVEFCFYFRLIIAFLQSLICWVREILAKASPILKWILGG